MMDEIQRLEVAAELSLDRVMTKDGLLQCSCGYKYEIDDGIMLSPNPYAIPSCPKCFDMSQTGEQNGE